MKNLIGYLKKTLYLFSIPLFLFSLSTPASAEQYFQIYTSYNHSIVGEIINTEVVLQIKSEIPRVLSYYTASIPIANIQTDCINYKTNEKLDCTFYHRGSVTDVLINLKNTVIKPENPLEIKFAYSTAGSEDMAYTFPSKINDTTTNSIVVRYPKEKGEPLWSSDPIQNIKSIGDSMEISVSEPVYSSLSLIFGENVTYRFDINKVFTNDSLDENQTFELYVPSDAENQIIVWESISPPPNITLQDEDGNYIFKYIVAPNNTLDCKISGYIQKIKSVENETPRSYLIQKAGYWSINNNTEFKRVNAYLKKKGLNIESDFDNINDLDPSQRELFYKYIYQYVIERLNYDENIVLGIYNETRLGANSLTESSDTSSTTDYADFYIALLREYMVPSRMIIGYVSNITGYSSDGFYHQWIEYFDVDQNKWITADPFLEEYFEKNLFGSSFHDHIVILKRGKSAVAPKISFFNTTDFIVRSESKEDIKAVFDLNAELSIEEYKITNRYLKAYVYVSNLGNTTINSYMITKSNIPNIQKYVDPINNLQSLIILPKQSSSFQLNIPGEEVKSSNIFLNIDFKNLGFQNKEITSEAIVEKKIPLYITILSKVISIAIFSTFVFLIYLGVKKFRKIKNG